MKVLNVASDFYLRAKELVEKAATSLRDHDVAWDSPKHIAIPLSIKLTKDAVFRPAIPVYQCSKCGQDVLIGLIFNRVETEAGRRGCPGKKPAPKLPPERDEKPENIPPQREE